MDLYREIFLMQQTYATLFSISNKLQVKGDKYLGILTLRQYMTMIAITHLSEDKTTLNNIAKKLGTTKQNVKQIVSIMEDKGYVEIVTNQLDRRSINVIITECGRKILYEVAEKGLFFLGEMFKDFTVEELEMMWGLLKKLYRFDGDEQDGFEEDSNFEVDESKKNEQTRILKEFERRRNQQRNGESKL